MIVLLVVVVVVVDVVVKEQKKTGYSYSVVEPIDKIHIIFLCDVSSPNRLPQR
jgi:hypothetical protein